MFELCKAKGNYVYNLEIYIGAYPTNSEHNMAFSVVDRLCDLRPFMGMQNNGCGHSDVQQKRNA